MITILPYGWRSLYAIGAGAIFLVAWLRRRLPETRRFAARGLDQKAMSKKAETLSLLRGLVREYPWRILTVVVAAGAFGFAMAAATVLQSKYLQSFYGYAPWQASAVTIPGGLIGLRTP